MLAGSTGLGLVLGRVMLKDVLFSELRPYRKAQNVPERVSWGMVWFPPGLDVEA